MQHFDHRLLLIWWWVAPVSELAAHFILRLAAPKIIEFQGPYRRAIVAGMNAKGIELAARLATDPYSRIRVVGFFDDRSDQRVSQPGRHPLLGKISALPLFARDNHIDLIYISLLIIALAVKFSSPGPAFFKQRRYGLDGREIIIYKFRTMRVITEALDTMKARIDYDLDYLRNWSLRLDLYIIAKTVWVVLREKTNAY